jgi:hypothetical protein
MINICKVRHIITPKQERAAGIEPAWLAWKARALPLSYARLSSLNNRFWYVEIKPSLYSSFLPLNWDTPVMIS